MTANYAYLLFPFVFMLAGIRRPIVARDEVVIILMFYTLIYVAGIPADLFEASQAGPARRLASFLVFLFPLFLALIEFRSNDVIIFKKAVVLSSLYYSIRSVTKLLAFSGELDLMRLKGEVGSQRYGYMLCLAFFVVLFDRRLLLRRHSPWQRVAIGSLLLVGMVLTFSRATIVSAGGGLAVSALLVFFRS